jgi:phosphatidylinositol-3-phosphatase
MTNNDSFNKTVTADNVVRHLLAAGKTWKAYEESLPKVGYTSPDTRNYVRRHCPLSYFSDVVNSSTQKLNLVPFTQFKADLANNALSDYSFITPNLCNDQTTVLSVQPTDG